MKFVLRSKTNKDKSTEISPPLLLEPRAGKGQLKVPILTHYVPEPLFSSDFDKICRAAYFRSKWNSTFF